MCYKIDTMFTVATSNFLEEPDYRADGEYSSVFGKLLVPFPVRSCRRVVRRLWY